VPHYREAWRRLDQMPDEAAKVAYTQVSQPQAGLSELTFPWCLRCHDQHVCSFHHGARQALHGCDASCIASIQAACQLLDWDAPHSTGSSRQTRGQSHAAGAKQPGSVDGSGSSGSGKQQQSVYGPVVSTLAGGDAAGADEVPDSCFVSVHKFNTMTMGPGPIADWPLSREHPMGILCSSFSAVQVASTALWSAAAARGVSTADAGVARQYPTATLNQAASLMPPAGSAVTAACSRSS
jgi:hypothetical protein